MKQRSYLSSPLSLLLIFTGLLPIAVSAADTPAPPVTMTCSMNEQGNVFSDASPHVSFEIKNSKPGTLTGTGTFTVTDQDGNQATTWTENLNIDGTATLQHDIPVYRYGLYTLQSSLVFSDDTKLEQTATFANVPPHKELTEAQKLVSPYGVNYHIFDPRFLDAFKKAGVYWFRCYAFTLDDMDKAKGADHSYQGDKAKYQLNYAADIADYAQHGMILEPILDALHPPAKDGTLGPSDEWAGKLHDVVAAFPSVKYWELANEYDLNAGLKTEPPVQWQNYLLYHKKFGEVVAEASHGESTAVENGRSEILPQTVERFIKTGDFDNIGVVNSHHYTGAEPPEVNFYNYNTGGDRPEDIRPGIFFDMLKAMKKAGESDGKKRQSWLSEFGWDTRFGPKVSNEQEAAYLQRAFLLIIASGTDRGFWFYNFDLKQESYFSGCGLFNVDRQPKLSLAAMAGMTSILPTPAYVGSINVGPNTAGYVFENEGKLIAALWAIKDTGPHVTFHAEELKDYLGNKMDGLSADLKIAPVYAIGLDKSDLLYRQTAYELDTPFRIEATAGDLIEPILIVKNNRAQEIKATIKITLPTGWTADKSEVTITVAPGEQQKIHLPYTIRADEALGPKEITFTCQEGTDTIKTITSTVSVVSHFEFQVGSISDPPGKTSVPVTIHNHTAFPQSGNLLIKVPQSWQVPTSTIEVKDIQPGEKRVTPVEVTWSADWKDGESASVTFQPAKGNPEERPIIPNQYHLNKTSEMTLDGNLSHWPKENAWPEWLLGSTSGAPKTNLWMAWAPEGLYVAVEVHDSTQKVGDPKVFWEDDSLELFVSTRTDDVSNSITKDDHHFWMVPQFKDNRVYVGEWIMDKEKDVSHYDIPEIKSAALQTNDGYIMECLLPVSAIQNFTPGEGTAIRLNAILNIHGNDGTREVYWPQNKASGVGDHPNDWGLLKLN